MNTASSFHEHILSGRRAFAAICGETPIPRFRKVRQKFPKDRIQDIPKAVRETLRSSGCLDKIRPGTRVALAVGSRGIANLQSMVATLVLCLKEAGAEPFIVPAMGSHGGATAAGQEAMLATLGITEEACGAPVRSSMEVVRIGETTAMVDGIAVPFPVYMDALALAADAVIPVVRVKPHTAFRGPVESGICKMLVIGLGKHTGALAYHKYGLGPFASVIPKVAEYMLQRVTVPFSLAAVENAFHETAHIEAVPGEATLGQEPKLLEKAFSLMGKIFFDQLDLLIVEEIGKNFSGDGADPNITGSYATPYAGKGLQAASRVILRLSEESHGNALGLGMADFTTVRAVLQIDPVATYTNSMTSRVSCVAKLPLVMPDDELAIRAGIYNSTSATADTPRIVKIANTNDVEIIEISEALWPEAEADARIVLEGEPFELAFDTGHMLVTVKRKSQVQNALQ